MSTGASWRFDGRILGLGTASGTRLIVGMWQHSPFGTIVDVMIEDREGRRSLVAPTPETADFISSTYAFDDVRIEPIALHRADTILRITSASLRIEARLGWRTTIGALLLLVPRPLARSRRWCRLINPIASRLRPGVQTHGSAGSGRREFYCALDERTVLGTVARWDGADLGPLARVAPPVRFGFASAPARPSLVRVTTLIDSHDPVSR